MAEENSKTSQLISISTWTIIKVILILLLLWFIYVIWDVLAILFVAILLTSVLQPSVDWLQQKLKIPRSLVVILIYLIILGIFALSLILLIPPIIEQVKELIKNSPNLLEKIYILTPYFDRGDILEGVKTGLSSLESSLGKTASGVYSTIISIFGGLASLVLVLVITFYMTIEEDAMKRVLKSVTPDKYLPYVTQLTNRIQGKLGLWLKGQLILSLIVGMLAYIGLKLIGIKYALVLAVLTGLLEFVPYLGPILAAVPAVLLAFVQEPIRALFVIFLYYVIHLLESNVLVPKIMQKALGLNPIIIILVLLIGAKLAGVIGVLLAVPVTTAVGVFLDDILGRQAER